MTKKWRSRLGVLAVLALAASMLAVLPVGAIEPGGPQVETGADIGAGSGAPYIICKWELPDADRDFSNGMQYGDDDLPGVDAGFPCYGLDHDTLYEQRVNVIQVMANPEDFPTERFIELWTAVTGTANVGNVDSVYWDIYHPDGTLKVQEHGWLFDGPPQDLGAYFDAGEYVLVPGGMWHAASTETGQIAPDTAKDQLGLIARAVQNDLQLWNGGFLLSKHQPCGSYLVQNYATYQGPTTMIENFIDVMCFVNLETDFETVQWGDITPGGTDWVYGDLNFGSGDHPTVLNTGSGGMALGIEFSHMARPDDPMGWDETAKRIEVFDAMFAINPDFLYGFDIPAYQPMNFGNAYHQVLCANETGKLDLSIHPPLGLPAGHYVGDLLLWGMGVGGEGSPCLNDHGVWLPPDVRFPLAG